MSELTFRAANAADLTAIVDMLSDDPLGARREDPSRPLHPDYERALQAIEADENIELVVACMDGAVIGVMQISFIPTVSRHGAWRAQIEGVRVASGWRSQGVGTRMFEWAIARARQRNCQLIQLTTDKARPEALKFYERLGFVASHVGLKLTL